MINYTDLQQKIKKIEGPIFIFGASGFIGINILENCEHVKAYIHAGSSSEYGTNSAGPEENGSLEPNSHYAASKVSASYIIQYYANFKSINALNLRLYSVYGYWEEPDRLIPM